MPLNIPDTLPAIKLLEEENIFVIDQSRASSQDIRPLRIAILNLMPLKIITETDLLRVLSNTPLQIEIEFLKISNHEHKNTSAKHMQTFYTTLEEVKQNKYDGLIITGAPVEHLKFEDVNYWNEIKQVLDWSKKNVTSSLFICWASQAALYHFHGIDKHSLKEKKFGVFQHKILNPKLPIFRGFDDYYFAPHSRYTEVNYNEVSKIKELDVISSSSEAGVDIVMSDNGKNIYIAGHLEYSRNTLDQEYKRDLSKGLSTNIPHNYYPNNNANLEPILSWHSSANLLFSNWLNYYVYQKTPYNIKDIK